MSSSFPQAAQHQLPWTKAARTRCRGHAAATPVLVPTSIIIYKLLLDTQVFFPPFFLPDRNLNASLRPRQLCLSPNVKVTLQAALLHRPALPMPTWSSSRCLRTPAEASSDGKRSPLPTQGNHRKKHLSFFKQPSLQPAARAEAGGKPPSSHMQMSFPNGGVLTSTSSFQPQRDALNTPSSPRAAAWGAGRTPLTTPSHRLRTPPGGGMCISWAAPRGFCSPPVCKSLFSLRCSSPSGCGTAAPPEYWRMGGLPR